MADPSPLTAPRWIVAHVLVATLTVTFVALGLWQSRRYGEESADQARFERQLAAPAVTLDELGADPDPDEHEFRRVVVSGTYAPADEVLLRSRAHNGVNGYHVLTPLVTAPGEAVLVNRGWVPFELDTPPVAEAAPPHDAVQVTGFLLRSQEPAGFGPSDPEDGRLDRMFRADVDRIEQQTDLSLHPMIVQLQEQSPPQAGRFPIPTGTPEPFDPTQNLSYAIQWFSFAAIAVVGYGLGLRRLVRRSPREPALAGGDRPAG